MEDIIGLIILYTFAGVGVLFPLFVIVQSLINLVRARDGRGIIIIKALTVLAVWAVITSIFIFIPIMFVFEPGTTDRAAADRRITILSIVLTLIYIAAGLAMAYWVRLQPGWKTLSKTQTEA